MFVLIMAAGIVLVSQTLAFASFPGQKAWAQRYDGLAAGQDGADDVQANPIENLVYVTGYTARATTDYSTIAYDPVTGAKKWSKSYDGPGQDTDAAVALAVSPDGTRVFVTGSSLGTANVDFATVSYDAVSGDPKWTARYDGGNGDDHARAIALSPDGSVVYVTGDSRGSANRDFATVAYDAATGAQIRAIRYDSGSDLDYPDAIAVSPDGSQVFVTGSGDQFANQKSITVANDATLQSQLWVATYHHKNGHGDGTDSIGVSPDGTRVFVTGWTDDQGLSRYLTIAYGASDGHTFWRKAYTNGSNGLADALAVSPDGNIVYVSGEGGSLSDAGYLTVAYSALTGARVWAKAYDGPGGGFDRVYDMVLSPSGAELFVTGESAGAAPSDSDYATVAYMTANGKQEWAKRYNGYGDEAAYGIATSPGGLQLFVTGLAQSMTGDLDALTISYYTH